MIKCILIPTDKPHIGCVGSNNVHPLFEWTEIHEQQDTLNKFVEYRNSKFYDIILVDTEAEIVEGDKYYDERDGILTCSCSAEKVACNSVGFAICHKIISSTDKSHAKVIRQDNLPTEYTKGGDIVPILQLSPNSIQLLINYYNEYKSMPESVDVYQQRVIGKRGVQYKDLELNKQGEVDITIPKIEERLYTEEEVRHKIVNFYLEEDNWDEDDVEEWLNKNIHSKKK